MRNVEVVGTVFGQCRQDVDGWRKECHTEEGAIALSRVARFVATVLGFVCASLASSAEPEYRDLKGITFFGSISATVHVDDPGNVLQAELSSAQLTRRAEALFAKFFPGTPYRRTAASVWSAPDNVATMGRLSCRVWVEAGLPSVAYQIKCQISTTAHPVIVDDGSIGYAPKDKVGAIVNQQIERVLAGLGIIFQSVKADL